MLLFRSEEHAEAWSRARGTTVGAFLSLGAGVNERHHLDAVLAAAHLPAQRPPGVVGEHVLPGPDVRLRDALRGEPREDGRPVRQRHAGGPLSQ